LRTSQVLAYIFILILRIMKDKALILKAIKDHYGFSTDAEFADFLGIAKTTLSSWYARGSIDYDLVYSKCVEIDGNFLLSGKGKIKRNQIGYKEKEDRNPIAAESPGPLTYNVQATIDALHRAIKAQETTIDSQKETIMALKEIILLKDPIAKKSAHDTSRSL